VGEKIVDSRVTFFSDPTDAQLLAQPFDGEGLPIASAGVGRERRVQAAAVLALLGEEAGRGRRRAVSTSLKMQGGVERRSRR
jgi:hypothetical protein